MDKLLELPVGITEIMKYMPHRYPFLLIDKVVGLELGKKITTVKNVTINEQFFAGHFPDYPVMPGVLIIEAMAQSAGVLNFLDGHGASDTELGFFAAIEQARFKRQVIPGDSLLIDTELVNRKRGVSKFSAVAKVDGAVAAIADIIIAVKGI